MKSTLINLVLTISTVLFFIFPRIAYPQEFQFRHYSSDEGFTGAAFKRMTQDSLGFLWISTGSGIFRFDGYDFEQVYSNHKTVICSVDPAGHTWFGLRGKLLYFVHARERFDSVMLPSAAQEATAFAFSDNKVWIGTKDEGLLWYDHNTDSVSVSRNLQDPEAGLINTIVHDNETLLLGTSHGLWYYDPHQNRFYRPPLMDEKLAAHLFSGNVKKIFSHEGYYWIWVDDLLLKIRPNGAIATTLDLQETKHRFDLANKFSQAEVTCIAESRDEKFWITTSGLGLIYYDPMENQCVNVRRDQHDENSLPSDVLYDVIVDKNDNVWCATVNKGIVRLKKRSVVFYNYLKGMSSTGIEILATPVSQQLIVGTNGAGLWTSSFDVDHIGNLSFRPFKFESASGFENILEMEVGKSTLWIGSLNSGVIGLPISNSGLLGHVPLFQFQHQRNDSTSLSQNFITSILETPDNYLWVGTYSEGLNVILPHSKSHSFKRYNSDHSHPGSMTAGTLRMIFREKDGSMLLINYDGVDQIVQPEMPYDQLKFKNVLRNNGCIQAIATSNRTIVLATTDGLLEGFRQGDAYRFERLPLPGKPHIVSLEEDVLGRIWCMSFEGLFFYDPKTKFALQFTQEDGLPSSRTVSAGRSLQTEEGIMIFSNAEGLTVFNPTTLKVNSAKPKPVLTSLKINNARVSPQSDKTTSVDLRESIVTLKNLELDYTHNILELEFSAMDMTAPEKSRYKYRLTGFSDTWVETDWRNRKAVYTNLSAGHYTFNVMATNRDGVWSDSMASLEIEVLPAPWNTWWAYSFYGFVILGVLYLARRSILKEERLKASLRIEQVELEKKEMELVKAQEVDKLKSSFFTNISHEFRTPLTLIQGPVQLLLERFSGDPKIKRQLQLIQNNVHLLLKLINQLLELSRLESGNITIDSSDTDLNAFIRSMLDYFESQARQKNLSLHLELPSESYRITVDKGKVETILINLIGNAMKFTPDHGKIGVKVNLLTQGSAKSGSGANLCLIVSDNGIGIPADQQTRIFDRFYQVSETHHQLGTGIGLALVKELTQLMKGDIVVKSQPGVGSEFIVTLPIRVLATGILDPVNFSESRKEGSIDDHAGDGHEHHLNVSKILVVEDNHDLRQFIIDSFDDAYCFIEAATGVEGLEKAIHEIPELIISDIMMPEMDGITMSSKIKRDIRTCHIPILFLTAKATDKSKLSGLETGAEDYLTKPFNKDELILKVRNIISAREKTRDKLRLELLNEAPVVVAQSSDEQFLVKVKEAIHRRLNDPALGVDLISRDVGLSRTQLYRKVNALTGFTVNELIRTFRLKKAAQLIDQNWGGVSEVAYEVGFSNLSYFSKCFKEHFGVLPSAYHHSKQS